MVSLVSALVLWWILFNPHGWLEGASAKWIGFAVVVLAVLSIPSGAAYVGHLVLQSVLDLPSKLREVRDEAKSQAKDALAPSATHISTRVFGFFKTIWAARKLIIDSKDAWGSAVAAVKLMRLASLPFVVGLLATFALNFVVIATAVVALGLKIGF